MGLVAPGEVEQWLAEQPRGGIVCRTPGIWMLEVNLKVVQQRYLKFLNSDVKGFQLCLVFFKWDDLEDQVLYFQSVIRILLP